MSDTQRVTFQTFATLIEETFDLPRGFIKPDTRCSDAPGWDSLGHSVLLSRLDKRFHLRLVEADAAPTDTVLELFEKISHLAAELSA